MVLGTIIRKGEDRNRYNYGQGVISMEWHFRIRRCKDVALFTRYASTGMRIRHIKNGYVYRYIIEGYGYRRLDRHKPIGYDEGEAKGL